MVVVLLVATLDCCFVVCTDERANKARPSSERDLCLRFCLHGEQAQCCSFLVAANSRVRRTNKMARPHGLSALPHPKENEHRSPSDKGAEHTQNNSEDTHAGEMGAVTRWPRTPPFLSLKSCPRVANSKHGHVVGNHRTHKLFCVEIGLPRGAKFIRAISPFLELPKTCTTLGIAGCNASS
ncbi:unnamed protein product [Ectocarpus sp. 6 AP-2014]